MDKFIHSISLTRDERKAFIYICGISLLSLLSVIQANVLYLDDIGRILYGHTGWEGNGRPLASLVINIIELGLPLTDISPGFQIIAIALYSLSSIYLAKALKVNNLVFLCLGGIVFVLNPFNLENFAYIFDSLTMGIAVFLATISFFLLSLFIGERIPKFTKIFIFILSLLSLICSLCFYQAATSIYIGASTSYSLFKLMGDVNIRSSVKSFILYIANLFLALLFYIPIKNLYVKGQYNLEHSKVASLIDIPKTLIGNLVVCLNYLVKSLGNNVLSILIAILIITSVTTICVYIYKEILKKGLTIVNVVIAFILVFLYFIILTFSISGLNLILLNPVWLPRTFMGFSAIIAISCFYLSVSVSNSRGLKNVLIVFMCLLCLSFANVSLTFGNLLSYQKSQEEIVGMVLLSDLEKVISNLSNPPRKPKIFIAAPLEQSRLNVKAFKKYPILKDITPSYFINWTHSYHRLESLGFIFKNLPDPYDPTVIDEIGKFVRNSKPIVSRRIYDIYLNNENSFIILFKS